MTSLYGRGQDGPPVLDGHVRVRTVFGNGRNHRVFVLDALGDSIRRRRSWLCNNADPDVPRAAGGPAIIAPRDYAEIARKLAVSAIPDVVNVVS